MVTDECRECRAGLEHCHGTVIHHVLLGAECTEPDCEGTFVAHAFRLDCDAVGCTCVVTTAALAS